MIFVKDYPGSSPFTYAAWPTCWSVVVDGR